MKTFSVRQNHYHLSVFKRKSFRVFLFPKKKSVGKTVPPMLHLSWFRAHWYSHNRHQSWLLTWFLSCVKIPSTKRKSGSSRLHTEFHPLQPNKKWNIRFGKKRNKECKYQVVPTVNLRIWLCVYTANKKIIILRMQMVPKSSRHEKTFWAKTFCEPQKNSSINRGFFAIFQTSLSLAFFPWAMQNTPIITKHIERKRKTP